MCSEVIFLPWSWEPNLEIQVMSRTTFFSVTELTFLWSHSTFSASEFQADLMMVHPSDPFLSNKIPDTEYEGNAFYWEIKSL